MVLPYLQSGELIEVMPQMSSSPMPISVVYLHNRHLSPKVRAFVDWVAELFGSCPLLRGCEGEGDKECNFAGKPGTNTIRAMLDRKNIAELVY